MSIIAAELILFGALSRPENDVSLTGGAIDRDNRASLVQLAVTDTLEMLSDNAGDTTQVVTITGRDATGAVVTEFKTLNGTSVVAFTTSFERVQKVVMDSDAVGNVTIRRASAGPTVGVIPPGERGFFVMFLNAASETSPTIRFEKIHWDNTNVSLTLNAALVRLVTDPSAVIRQGVEAAKNDSATVANRKATPAGVTFVDDGVDQGVPSTTLESGSTIGVWTELALAADNVPIKDTFTTRLAGTSI